MLQCRMSLKLCGDLLLWTSEKSHKGPSQGPGRSEHAGSALNMLHPEHGTDLFLVLNFWMAFQEEPALAASCDHRMQ